MTDITGTDHRAAREEERVGTSCTATSPKRLWARERTRRLQTLAHLQTFAFVLAEAILAASCAANVDGSNFDSPETEGEAEDIAKAEQALFGDVTFINTGTRWCTADQQQYLRQMVFLARTAVTTPAFEECVWDRVINGPYIPCSQDQPDAFGLHALNAINAARNVNGVGVTCDPDLVADPVFFQAGTDGVNFYDTFGNYSQDNFTALTFLNEVAMVIGPLGTIEQGEQVVRQAANIAFPEPWALGAGLTVHEVLHQHNYRHWAPSPDTNGDGQADGPGSTDATPLTGRPGTIACANDAQCRAALPGSACAGATPTTLGVCYNQFQHSMPDIVLSCAQEVLTRSHTDCGGGFCMGRTNDDLQVCQDAGQLTLIDTMAPSPTCSTYFDPNKRGKGILHFEAGDLEALDIVPTGRPYNSGWINSAGDSYYNTSGNLDPSSTLFADEFLVKSGWGFGVIGVSSWTSTLSTVTLAAHGTVLSHWGDGGTGTWTLQSNNSVLGIARMSSAAQYGATTPVRDEIVIEGSTSLGVLAVVNGALRTRSVLPSGTNIPGPFGNWQYDHASNTKRLIGNVNGDPDQQAEILVGSGWGKALLSRTGPSGSFQTIDITPSGGAWGSWITNSGDQIIASGDFNGDGRTDMLVKSGWGLGLIGMPAGQNRLTSLWLASWGTVVSGLWALQSSDSVVALPGRLSATSRDSVLIKGAGGLVVLSFGTGNNPSASIHAQQRISESGQFPGSAGNWTYSSTNNIVAVGDYDGDGFASFVIKSPWGMAVIGRNAWSPQLAVQTIRNNSCGDADDTACHGQLWGSWLSRETDVPVQRLRSGVANVGDFLFMKSD